MEYDVFSNIEKNCLRQIFPKDSPKLYSQEELSRRVDSLENLIVMMMERLYEIDGKRLLDQATPEGIKFKFHKPE